MIDEKFVEEMLSLLGETAADIVLAVKEAHPNIWEDRKTWTDILLEDAQKVSNMLVRYQEEKEGAAK